MAEMCVEREESRTKDSKVLEEDFCGPRTVRTATSTTQSIASSLILIFHHHDIVYYLSAE
jgi:hypothetical protein